MVMCRVMNIAVKFRTLNALHHFCFISRFKMEFRARRRKQMVQESCNLLTARRAYMAHIEATRSESCKAGVFKEAHRPLP